MSPHTLARLWAHSCHTGPGSPLALQGPPVLAELMEAARCMDSCPVCELTNACEVRRSESSQWAYAFPVGSTPANV